MPIQPNSACSAPVWSGLMQLASLGRALYIHSMSTGNRKKLVNVVFPQLPHKQLTYEIPPVFQSILTAGHRVIVSIGRRLECGIAFSFPENTALQSLKPIEDIVEADPVLSEDLIRLAVWTAGYYMAEPGEVVRAMLPPALHHESRMVISLKPSPDSGNIRLPDKQQKVISAFKTDSSLSLDLLKKRVPITGLRYLLSRLEAAGFIDIRYTIQNAAGPKTEKIIHAATLPSPSEWTALKQKAPRQAAVLEHIITEKELHRSEIQADLQVLKRLETRGWISISEREVFRDAYEHIKPLPPGEITLTEHQSAAVSQMTGALKSELFTPFLLYGVTASGKTQVYLELVKAALDLGKTALILIPEISLTPQAVQRYRSRFGNAVAILHSRMSAGERVDSWRKIQGGQCRIALGPRSAIFAPLKNLGVIIVDEEHDNSYKQNDPAPRYHARDLAVMRASINQCIVVLGSATPSLESYANATLKKYRLCSLPERIDNVPMPKIFLVDRNSVPGEYKKRLLSPVLEEKIHGCLQQKEQTILLQNRRGYATYLRCQACGHIESCTNCDITLTYHQTDRSLRCHLCGYQKQAPGACTQCQGANLRYRGAGTQKVEEEFQSVFPEKRLLRMDLDTTRTKHAHTRIITSFEKHEADILLGTQMVSKGHDFPGVSLVGIISADTGLLFPDFRAEEQTFQMLTQAAGRAGRRNRQGEVVIQTFYPDHPVFEFVLSQDYTAFYDYAVSHRMPFNYPPFGRLIAIRLRSGEETQVENAARAFIKGLPERDGYDLLGPVASPISKKKGQYRYQIILRNTRKSDPAGRKLRNIVQTALNYYKKRFHYPDVRLTIDVDPMDML